MSREFPVLSPEQSRIIAAGLERYIERLGTAGRGVWAEFAKANGKAALTRLWRCRYREAAMREADAKLLARFFSVTVEELRVLGSGQRHRPLPPSVYCAALNREPDWLEQFAVEIEERAAELKMKLGQAGRPCPARFERALKVDTPKPTELFAQVSLASERAMRLREHLGLGHAPVPSLRWVFDLLHLPRLAAKVPGCPAHVGVVSGRCHGRPVLIETQYFATLTGATRRENVGEALWRLLLRDSSGRGGDSLAAMRAFFLPVSRDVPRDAAECAETRQRIACIYGVSEALVWDRLNDWRALGSQPLLRKRNVELQFDMQLPNPYCE